VQGLPPWLLELAKDPAVRALFLNVGQAVVQGKKRSKELHWGRDDGKPELVAVPDFRPGDPPLVKLGDLVYVEYLTKKGIDGPTVYFHDFGEDGGKFPGLYSNGDDLVIVRQKSRYRVRAHGIIG